MKCNTCFAAFPSLELVKEHYRTEWHCLNAKRRGQGLAALKRDQFLAVQASLPKKSKAQAKTTSGTSPQKVLTPAAPVEEEEADDVNAGQKAEMQADEKEDSSTLKEELPQPMGPAISIFDDKAFGSTEECVQYMAEHFGFFIPDVEFLTDLDGMLTFLHEKVKLGVTCLYCQKRFSSGRACQNHMISKSHCKIAYDEDIDGQDFDDFYDFSSTYEDVDDDEDGVEEMEPTHTGELQLPDGRLLGHRQFRRYYKQYYRPAESRLSVLAQQREELMRLGYKFGGAEWSLVEVTKMSDSDVMTNIIRYQKSIRKGEIVEQRMAKRRHHMDQRRLVNRTIDKLRSSENTTAKIRDYHNRLM